MSEQSRDYNRDLRAIFNGAAESVRYETDKELQAELRMSGLDPASEAGRVRNLLLSAVEKAKLNEDTEPAVAKRER